MLAAREYQRPGKRWVVELDLVSFTALSAPPERSFAEVDHDLLIARAKRRVKDVQAIRLVRAYLNAGVLSGWLVQATDKGTPRGGRLSELLPSPRKPKASRRNWTAGGGAICAPSAGASGRIWETDTGPCERWGWMKIGHALAPATAMARGSTAEPRACMPPCLRRRLRRWGSSV